MTDESIALDQIQQGQGIPLVLQVAQVHALPLVVARAYQLLVSMLECDLHKMLVQLEKEDFAKQVASKFNSSQKADGVQLSGTGPSATHTSHGVSSWQWYVITFS